jgi:HPt (histidine-containing phosphotransfer) domain-containing protein
MDGYLTKPLEPETLYAELCRWLRVPAAEIGALERPAPAVDAALPGFDAANVRRWLDQAPDAWRGMARAFVAESPATATAIGTALDAGDRARAANLLHRLRGAAGVLGAEELCEVAGRLEVALADDGPVDTGLHDRFLTSAEAALAIIAGLEEPAPRALSAGGQEPGCAQRSQRLHELEALLEAGNTRALEHLPWLEGWVDREAPGEARELMRQIEALDFPAALETLRGLGEDVFANPR